MSQTPSQRGRWDRSSTGTSVAQEHEQLSCGKARQCCCEYVERLHSADARTRIVQIRESCSIMAGTSSFFVKLVGTLVREPFGLTGFVWRSQDSISTLIWLALCMSSLRHSSFCGSSCPSRSIFQVLALGRLRSMFVRATSSFVFPFGFVVVVDSACSANWLMERA